MSLCVPSPPIPSFSTVPVALSVNVLLSALPNTFFPLAVGPAEAVDDDVVEFHIK